MTLVSINTSVNVPPDVLTLDGLSQLSDHRLFFFFFFLSAFVFALCSDGLVVFVICSQRSLHRPMLLLVAAVLLNSVAGSVVFYPWLLWGLLWSGGPVQVSVVGCVCQAWALYTLGASSFMLLGAMAFDRYLSICRPLRYSALVTPTVLTALLLLCWLLPAVLVGGGALLASRLPLCSRHLSRINCDIYSLVSLSCGGPGALLSEVYGLLTSAVTVLLPVVFVLFSYGSILSVSVRRSHSFSSKALNTCLPHLLVFLNYSLSAGVELLQRRLQADTQHASILSSILVAVVPTVFNPVVYGLKVSEIYNHVRRLLGCSRAGA